MSSQRRSSGAQATAAAVSPSASPAFHPVSSSSSSTRPRRPTNSSSTTTSPLLLPSTSSSSSPIPGPVLTMAAVAAKAAGITSSTGAASASSTGTASNASPSIAAQPFLPKQRRQSNNSTNPPGSPQLTGSSSHNNNNKGRKSSGTGTVSASSSPLIGPTSFSNNNNKARRSSASTAGSTNAHDFSTGRRISSGKQAAVTQVSNTVTADNAPASRSSSQPPARNSVPSAGSHTPISYSSAASQSHSSRSATASAGSASPALRPAKTGDSAPGAAVDPTAGSTIGPNEVGSRNSPALSRADASGSASTSTPRIRETSTTLVSPSIAATSSDPAMKSSGTRLPNGTAPSEETSALPSGEARKSAAAAVNADGGQGAGDSLRAPPAAQSSPAVKTSEAGAGELSSSTSAHASTQASPARNSSSTSAMAPAAGPYASAVESAAAPPTTSAGESDEGVRTSASVGSVASTQSAGASAQPSSAAVAAAAAQAQVALAASHQQQQFVQSPYLPQHGHGHPSHSHHHSHHSANSSSHYHQQHQHQQSGHRQNQHSQGYYGVTPSSISSSASMAAAGPASSQTGLGAYPSSVATNASGMSNTTGGGSSTTSSRHTSYDVTSHHHPHSHHGGAGGGPSSTPHIPSSSSISGAGGFSNAGNSSNTSTYAYERLTNELTSNIIAFLTPILPTEEEYRIKEATRRQLERLACRVSPGAKLLAFGSMANGFALRNSDMDLCCLLSKKEGQTEERSASLLVEILGALIREETDFNVMMLPKARIPIIKISRMPSADLPYEISCDIGFENRLALENTRLLLSYAMVDPPRLRTLVLFLKVWTKRRKLNSPYTGTLSSYGYTLLVLFFLCHVKRPPVLPNLQRIPPSRPLNPEEVELNGHNIYFYDDIATLRQEWNSANTENVGELLIDFFRYFSKEFSYSRDVISLRTEGGLMSKDKDWTSELCIEDPFQLGYNVSRTVTKDGLYTIRGEFMRATRILLGGKHQRVTKLIDELCEEREDIISRAPDTPIKRHPPLGPHARRDTIAGSSTMAGSGNAGGAAPVAGTGGLGLGFGYHHATAGTLAASSAAAALASPPPVPASTSATVAAAAAAAAAAATAVPSSAGGAGTHAAGLIDPRLMREYREFYDTPRRYDSSYASGLGGSFAFEEMARGLGLGQQGYRTVPAYPPTTAMLAPLSQNNGLAQRMVGSGHRGASVSAATALSTTGAGGASAQTSSRKSSSPVQRGGASGTGSSAAGGPGAGSEHGPSESDIAFANALNRSKSLPRPFIDDRRSSTPMRSEPASPKLGPSVSQRTPARDFGPSATFHALQPAMASLSVSGNLPRPPAPQRSQSGLTPASTAAASSRSSPSAMAATGNGTEPPSPVFGYPAGGDGGATTSTPMSMSASAGPARYIGASVPAQGSMAWPYGPSSSAAIAAAYQAAAAAAAAAVAAGYPASAAAYPYATPVSMSSGSTGANASVPSTGSVPTPASVSLASYPSQTQASPMQYPQGFPAGAAAYDHHAQLHARSSYGLDSSVGSLPSVTNEDVFGTVSGAPMIPGMAMGMGYGGPTYVQGMGPAGAMHGVGLGMQGYHGIPNGEMPGEEHYRSSQQAASDYAEEVEAPEGIAAPSRTRRADVGGEESGSSSDLSEGVLDELARVSEMEAKEDAGSPEVGATDNAGAESGGKAGRTTGPDVDIPAASPAIDIAPASTGLTGSRRQSGAGVGL